MDPLDLDLDRFVNLVHYWLVRNLDDKDRRRFEDELRKPIAVPTADGKRAPRVSREPPGGAAAWSRENEMAHFRAAQGQASVASR